MINHVRWYVNVKKWSPTKDEWLKFTMCIGCEEVERINKFAYKNDAKSSLLGCALIRKFLTHATKIPSHEIEVTRDRYGRPRVSKSYIPNQSSWPNLLDFNVSHSGDYCVLAGIWSNQVRPDIRIGVDVTKIVSKSTPQELTRFLDLMSRREFTAREWATVEKASSDRQKSINFTRLWCLKESYIKAIGLGLSFKLDRIEFQYTGEQGAKLSVDTLKQSMICDTSVLLDGQPALDWRFVETALDDEHIVALGYNFRTDGTPCDLSNMKLDSYHFEELSIRSILDALTPMSETNDADWLLYCTRQHKIN